MTAEITFDKIVLVTRKTRLEGLIERFNTRAQARFYIEHSGGNFGMFEAEHETYYGALGLLRERLKKLLKTQVVERGFLPNFLFSDSDLVVTLGIDGLVVNTAKYLTGQPLVAVNPDPAHIDGVLLPYDVNKAPPLCKLFSVGNIKPAPLAWHKRALTMGKNCLPLTICL